MLATRSEREPLVDKSLKLIIKRQLHNPKERDRTVFILKRIFFLVPTHLLVCRPFYGQR